jgi:S1-C subfamily serine protease
MIRDIDGSLMEEKNLKLSEGSYVDSLVENSAAAKAGLLPGDVITEINGQEVQKSSDLMEQVGRQRPGDEVSVTVNRDGKTKSFMVQLADRNGEFKLASAESMDILDVLGATFEELDSDKAEKLGIEGGVIIKELRSGLLKNQTSVSEGFIITSINNKQVEKVEDVRKLLEKEKGGVLIQGIYENYPGELYFAFGLPE